MLFLVILSPTMPFMYHSKIFFSYFIFLFALLLLPFHCSRYISILFFLLFYLFAAVPHSILIFPLPPTISSCSDQLLLLSEFLPPLHASLCLSYSLSSFFPQFPYHIFCNWHFPGKMSCTKVYFGYIERSLLTWEKLHFIFSNVSIELRTQGINPIRYKLNVNIYTQNSSYKLQLSLEEVGYKVIFLVEPGHAFWHWFS